MGILKERRSGDGSCQCQYLGDGLFVGDRLPVRERMSMGVTGDDDEDSLLVREREYCRVEASCSVCRV